jgi:hypothetical protein
MSDPEPSQWQIALTVMRNAREVQRRADSDGLRYVGLLAAFLLIRESATSSLTFLGLEINDTKLIQFALVPAAAFFAIRYSKAQVLSGELAQFLRCHFEKNLPDVPPLARPPDWDIARDITHRVPPLGRLVPVGMEVAMYAVVIVGAIVNLLDATETNRLWAWLTSAATAALLATTLPVRREWKMSVIGRGQMAETESRGEVA